MSTKQAVFVRSYKDPPPPGEQASLMVGDEKTSRKYSMYSAYSLGAGTGDGWRRSPGSEARKIEDDLETVLDTNESIPPYDETGKRTYERACRKVGVTPVSNCLRNLEYSQALDLQYYGLGPRSVIPVAMALMINNQITNLNLQGNCLTAKGVVYIQKMMEDNNVIVDINLAANDLRSEGAECIANMLKVNKKITHLDISANGFVDCDAMKLTKAVENHPRMSVLNLSHNTFGDKSAHHFAHLLSENVSLQELNLSWNHFRGKGAQVLAKGLSENHGLKVLDVSWNGFEDEGALAMARALAHNGVLVELDLACNRLTPQGFLDLVKALGKNDTLQVLKVGKNNISDAGAEMAVDMMKKMSSLNLQLLDLSDVILANTIGLRLEELAAVHPELQVRHGYTDSYGKRKLKAYDMVDEALEIIQHYCQQHNLSLVDLFAKFDADGSMSVTHDEFRQGLREAKIPLSSLHVDKLIDQLDQDGDGEIDFGELVIGAEVSGSSKASVASRKSDRDIDSLDE